MGDASRFAAGECSSAPRPASASFDTDGGGTVTSFEGANGLYPGNDLVTISCMESADMPEPGKPAPKNFAPSKYQNTELSGLALTVEPGKTPKAEYDVKSK